MSILIIRHGETVCNLSGIVQFPDDPLSPRGRRQAKLLGARVVADYRVGGIVCSDYLRARDTAGFLQRATGARLTENPLLRERHFGELRGRRAADIGDIWHVDLAPGGGEDWRRFHERVARAWAEVTELAAATEGDLAVVTHGMVCHSLLLKQLHFPEQRPLPRLFANTSLTEVEPAPPWTIRRLDCSVHLADAESPAAESPAPVV